MQVATDELGLDRMWSFKVWYLFPALAPFRNLDHFFRYAFILAYLAYALVAAYNTDRVRIAEHFELVGTSVCQGVKG